MIEVFIDEKYLKEINGFKCEDEPSVEEFLKEYALKYHESNLARTRLYFNEQRQLIGYITLFTDYVTVVKSKRDQQNWNLPSVQGKAMFPAIRLHYLGVDTRFRKLGYGKLLLYFAIDISKQIAVEVGCSFLSIEALNSSVDFYTKFEFKLLNRQNKFLTNMIFILDEI